MCKTSRQSFETDSANLYFYKQIFCACTSYGISCSRPKAKKKRGVCKTVGDRKGKNSSHVRKEAKLLTSNLTCVSVSIKLEKYFGMSLLQSRDNKQFVYFVFRLPRVWAIPYFLQNFDSPIGCRAINKFPERRISKNPLSVLIRACCRVTLMNKLFTKDNPV